MRTTRPVWTADSCLACGACTRRCPASVFPEQVTENDSLRGQVARSVKFPAGPRPAVPPCQAACPLGQDVPGYTRAIAAGDFDRALQVICRSNPFPGVLSRLCTRGCERACVRAAIQTAAGFRRGAAPFETVPIRALKRAAVEFGRRPSPWAPQRERGIGVAVIGAGPAGLSAAVGLRRAGFSVEVREKESRPGGLLRLVPAFDLPPEVLQRDLEFIESAGVTVRCGVETASMEDLQKLRQEFAAVIIATGAGRDPVPGTLGTGGTGVLSFCRSANRLSGPAVVAGDGVQALAAARLARQAGADPVTWVVSRRREDLGVDTGKLRAALGKGVQLLESHGVTQLEGGAHLERVVCRELGAYPADAAGRRPLRRLPDAPVRKLPAAIFILAVGRGCDLDWLPAVEFPRGPLGLLQSDGEGRTLQAGVYLAGETMFGERNLVGAVASGLRTAAAVAGDLLRGGS